MLFDILLVWHTIKSMVDAQKKKQKRWWAYNVLVFRRQYKHRYSPRSRQQTLQRPMIADKTAAVTPKFIGPGAAGYMDDVNDYGGGCVVHRPLPSLPRRMEGSWAKSVRSDASGSDASLHWDTQDDDTTGVDVDDLPPPSTHSRAVRCRSVAAGPGDYGTAGRGGVGVGPQQPVHDVHGYRTMPRPGVQYGVLVSDEMDPRRLIAAQQQQQLQRRHSRPSDNTDFRQYVNISEHSVDVWH